MQRSLLTALALGALLSAASAGAEAPSAEGAGLSLTIYQQHMALVRDRRQVELHDGRQELELQGLSEQIRPETLRVDGPGLTVHRRRFQPGDLSRDALLEHYLGREVLLLRDHPETGETISQPARLLSLQGAPVVALEERIETLDAASPWRIAYPRLPAGLGAEPRLGLELSAPAGTRTLTLTYLSGGLGWQADYVATLRGDNRLHLSGWASLRNDTASDFPTARVQLLAGDVQQAGSVAPMARMELKAAADAAPASQPIGGYHLYDLAEPVTLPAQQMVQVPLVDGATVPVQRWFRTEGSARQPGRGEQPQPVSLQLRFANSGELGRPLPAGVLRVYRDDEQGRAQFLGEDRIDHTAADQDVELRLGRSFDVSAEREQTAYRRLSPELIELSWRIRLANAAEQPAVVEVVENLGGDWRITETSHPDYQRSADQARWRIKLPAGGSRELSYRVQFR